MLALGVTDRSITLTLTSDAYVYYGDRFPRAAVAMAMGSGRFQDLGPKTTTGPHFEPLYSLVSVHIKINR